MIVTLYWASVASHLLLLHAFFNAKILQDKVCFVAKFLKELYSVCTSLFHYTFVIALKEWDTSVSNFRVFLYKKVKGILQSIQNQALRLDSKNVDLIQKYAIK